VLALGLRNYRPDALLILDWKTREWSGGQGHSHNADKIPPEWVGNLSHPYNAIRSVWALLPPCTHRVATSGRKLSVGRDASVRMFAAKALLSRDTRHPIMNGPADNASTLSIYPLCVGARSAFALGAGSVIRGGDEGVQGMKIGGYAPVSSRQRLARAHAA
jgi:hypothetical protein